MATQYGPDPDESLPNIDPDNPHFIEVGGIAAPDMHRRITRLERIILYNSKRTEAIMPGEIEQHILDMVGELEECEQS